MENVKESKGKGVAFEVILRPATSDAPPTIPSCIAHPNSPTKERPLSQNDIDRKLKEAEERRLSLEASRLQLIAKEKERLQEANQKAQELNEAFSRETEKKLTEKMEAFEEKKRAQEMAKLERIKEHDRHAEEVRKKRQSQPTDSAAANGSDAAAAAEAPESS